MRRLAGAMTIALVCSLAIAACGSAAPAKKPLAHKGSFATFLPFSECMRSHGVPNFPDPGPEGGIQIPGGSNINLASPSFKEAQSRCSHLLPGGGPRNQTATKQAIAAAVKTSECMRAHGVSGFPDPTETMPASPQGYSEIEDRGGVVMAIPTTIDVMSPTFEKAAQVCDFH
jgi:hypothetical protein